MPYKYIRAEDLEPAFRATLQEKKGSLWIKEVTDLFPWCVNHRLYWATTLERRNAIAVVTPSGTIQMLTLPGGWKLLSGVLVSEKGPLPANLSAVQIAEAVRKLTIGPPGMLATSELAQRSSPPLSAWTTDKPHGNEVTFRSLCVTPVLESVAPHGAWRVVFNYFNDRGGVEHWTVNGEADGLVDVKMEPLFVDDTFNWPFE